MAVGISLFCLSGATSAAPACSTVGGQPVNIGDPACWTSSTSNSTSTSTTTCNWIKHGIYCYWPDVWDGSRNYQTTGSCLSGSKYHADAYINSCTNSFACDNGYYNLDSYTITNTTTSTTTSYTCYYTTVSEWSVCDVDTGLQSATDVTQHSTSGTTCDNLSEDTTQSCAACGLASNTPTGEQPSEDLCIPLNTASTPALNTTTNMWEWTCTADNGSVDCDVPNSEHGVCSSIHTGHAFETQGEFDASVANGTLCETGTVVNASGDENTGWTWDCMHIGDLYTNDDLNCQAPCFDYSLNIDKNQFYWDDNDQVNITVNVEKVGACADEYSCTVTDATSSGIDTFTRTIDAEEGKSAYDVSSICTRDGYEDEEKTSAINGNCIARSCNAQGKCQGTPQSASSSSSCTSTCSSDADCTTGRMIETRP